MEPCIFEKKKKEKQARSDIFFFISVNVQGNNNHGQSYPKY